MFRALRKRQGFRTVKELADKLGFKPARIFKWEVGASSPKNQDLFLVAETLNVSVEEVLSCFK